MTLFSAGDHVLFERLLNLLIAWRNDEIIWKIIIQDNIFCIQFNYIIKPELITMSYVLDFWSSPVI